MRILLLAVGLSLACERASGRDKPAPPADAALPAPIVPDCSSSHAPRPERDAASMCRVGGGSITGPDGRPRPVAPFFMDEREVTAGQFARFLNDKGAHDFCAEDKFDGTLCIDIASEARLKRATNVGPHHIDRVEGRYVPVDGRGDLPANWVTWQGARAYCEWAGKRLPDADEWMMAAYWDPRTWTYRRHPWGNEFHPNHANCAEESCRDGFEFASPVGIFNGKNGRGDGRSLWGVHDLGGNLHEYTNVPGRFRGDDFLAPHSTFGVDWNSYSGSGLTSDFSGFRCALSTRDR